MHRSPIFGLIMPIVTQCPGCQSQFHLQDQLAGQQVQCQNCSTVFVAPHAPAPTPATPLSGSQPSFGNAFGQPDPLQSPPPSSPAPHYGQTHQKKTQGGNKGLLIGVIAIGVLLLIGGIVAAMMFSQTSEKPITEKYDDGLTSEVRAKVDKNYAAKLEKDKVKQSSGARSQLASRFNTQYVTVKFKNVSNSDTTAVSRYLRTKVKDAAYSAYSKAAKVASDQTEANRKRAEQEAIRNSHGQFIVHYKYRQVQSSLPYPQIIDAGRVGNTYTFHAGPCVNPQQFATNIGLGSPTSVSTNLIEINPNLPSPVPHPQVEKLWTNYGKENVVKVVMYEAKGDPELIELHVEKSGPQRLGSSYLRVTAFEQMDLNEYQYHVAPVSDLQEYADQLDWGTVSNVDSANKTVYVNSALPSQLLTVSQWSEKEKQERELENAKRDLERKKEQLARDKKRAEDKKAREEQMAADRAKREAESAVRDADNNGKPRPGESLENWVYRYFDDPDVPSYRMDDFLEILAKKDVDENLLETVNGYVRAYINENKNTNFEQAAKCLMKWRTAEGDELLISIVGDDDLHGQDEILMDAMAAIASEESIKQLATALSHSRHGDKAATMLIQLGPDSVEPTMTYLRHNEPEVRVRAYRVLGELGDRDIIPALQDNRGKEKDRLMKEQVKFAIKAIEARHPKDD